jgi:hypothetical protein
MTEANPLFGVKAWTLLAIGALGCSGSATTLSIDLSDAGGPLGDHDAGLSGPGSGADGGGKTHDDGGADAAPIDVQTDPKNCGAIGHNCRGASCAAGLCAPAKLHDGAGEFGLSGTTMFQQGSSNTIVSGSTSPGATMTTFATLGAGCTHVLQVVATPKYVVVNCSAEMQVISRQTKAITTTVYDKSPLGPWRYLAANDSDIFYFDGDQGDLWYAPTPGAKFIETFATQAAQAVIADANGVFTVTNNDVIAFLPNGSTTATGFTGGSVGGTWSIAYDTNTLFGVRSSGRSACGDPNSSSQVWSVARTGGMVSTVAHLPFLVGQLLADDHGLVVVEQCGSTANGVLANPVWELPLAGGAPLLLSHGSSYNLVSMDRQYVYLTLDDPAGANTSRIPR